MEKMQAKQDQDSELWAAFREGNQEAYAEIYERYAKVMYIYGIRFTNNYELIEDCIHDIFVKLYNDRKKLPEVSNLKFYLFISLKNSLLNKKSEISERFSLELIENTLPSYYASVEEKMISEEKESEYNRVFSLINDILSSRQKQVIYYKYVEQLSYKEISERMNINIQSAKNMSQIALKKIRSHLSDTSIIPIIFLLFYC